MGDRVGKCQQTRVRIKHMHERGDIDLDRMQRSMGALNSKVRSSRSHKSSVCPHVRLYFFLLHPVLFRES